MIRSAYHHGDERPAVGLTERQLRTALNDPAGVLWVDINTVDDKAARRFLGEALGLHPIEIDAAVDDGAAPGIDDNGTRTRWVVHRLGADSGGAPRRSAVAFTLGPNYLVTSHRGSCPPLEDLMQSASEDAGIVADGSDLLAARAMMALADEAVERTDDLGAEIGRMSSPPPSASAIVEGRWREVRRELRSLRRDLASQQAALAALAEAELPAVREASRLYYRGALDRVSAALYDVDEHADAASSIREAATDAALARMGEGLRLLVVVHVVVLPLALTLLVLMYALIVLNLPPPDSPVGGLLVLLAMAAIVGVGIVALRRRHCL